MKSDNDKPSVPKTFKRSSNSENKDPQSSDFGRKAPVGPGGSRLPVLAKSLSLQTSSNFSQSHNRWEEKPLAGKAKKKRPCTRPVPFNFSQPRGSRVATERQQPLNVQKSHNGTHPMQPENNVCTTKTVKYLAVLNSAGILSKSAEKSNAKTAAVTSLPSGQSGPCSTFKPSATFSNPKNWVHENGCTTSVQPAVAAKVCLDDMKQLSLKDPSKTSSHTSQNTQHNPPRGEENFQSDHSALLSILRNEGVTSQSKPNNHQAQRVSIMKSRPKPGCTPGPVRLVHFSPDAASLQSILLNEGVKAGGPPGATPRNSVCPPGRGTSIYTPQRVPHRKAHAEAPGRTPAAALKETPLKKWAPQRVQNPRHQPMSAVKWELSTWQSPFITPVVRSCKKNQQPQQEEVVQKLFDDLEDEQSAKGTDKDPDAPAEQHQVQDSKTKSTCDEKRDVGRIGGNEEQQRFKEGTAFLQAPHRGSVIFFSTGKKLFRAPCPEKQESSSAPQAQHGPLSLDTYELMPTHHKVSAESEPTRQINPSEHLHREFTVQKTSSLRPVVAVLRKRLPLVEDIRMDEEVAAYTSLCGPTPEFHLPLPSRCGNPLASILHFEESRKFVPVSEALSACPSSPLYH